jgi:hypothetical protein
VGGLLFAWGIRMLRQAIMSDMDVDDIDIAADKSLLLAGLPLSTRAS